MFFSQKPTVRVYFRDRDNNPVTWLNTTDGILVCVDDDFDHSTTPLMRTTAGFTISPTDGYIEFELDASTSELEDALGGEAEVSNAQMEIQITPSEATAPSRVFRFDFRCLNVMDDQTLSPTDVESIYLLRSNNLSDLSNVGTARTNLGLGDAAVKDVDTTEPSTPDDDHVPTSKLFFDSLDERVGLVGETEGSIPAGSSAVVDEVDLSSLMPNGGMIEWDVTSRCEGHGTISHRLVCTVHWNGTDYDYDDYLVFQVEAPTGGSGYDLGVTVDSLYDSGSIEIQLKISTSSYDVTHVTFRRKILAH